jgi:hypothetical protein
MKNTKILLAAALLAFALSACGGPKGDQNPIVTGEQADKMTAKLFDVDNDICEVFTPDFIYSVTKKPVVKFNGPTDSGGFGCIYYFEYREDFYKVQGKTASGGPNVNIILDNIPVARHMKSMETFKLKLSTDPRIKVDHWIARRDDGSIWEVGIKLNENRFLWINQLNDPLTDDQLIGLGARMAELIGGKLLMKIDKNPGIVAEVPKEIVLPPTQEDLARNFFNLIGEGKIDDALKMMDANSDTKQMWGVNFNSVSSLKVKSVEPAFKDEWTAERVTYKVMLEVKAKAGQNAWSNGLVARWITLTKTVTGWVVHELANNP